MPRVFRRSWKAPDGSRVFSEHFYLDLDVGGRRVIRRTDPPTASKQEAKAQLARAVTAANDASRRPESVLALSGLLDRYAAHLKRSSPSTWKRCGYRLKFWNERMGERAVATLAPSDVEAAIAELRAKGYSDATVSGYWILLRAALRQAVRDGVISEDPVAGARVKTSYPERHSTWTEDELARVAAELPPWAGRFVRFLRWTGLRVSDALALEWEAIDGERIRIVQQKTRSLLAVPLAPEAAAILMEIQPDRGKRTGLVFPGINGQVRRYDRIIRTIRAGMKRAGVEGRTIHDLRRTFATGILNRGWPLEIVAALLGQASTRIAGRYTHAEAETLARALRGRPE